MIPGVIRFVQVDSETCVIDGTLDGLSPGAEHGVAIHASGDFSNGCGADPDVLGGHYNPRQGCQMAKFDPFLSLDCARVEGVGAQSKEWKGSNFAA